MPSNNVSSPEDKSDSVLECVTEDLPPPPPKKKAVGKSKPNIEEVMMGYLTQQATPKDPSDLFGQYVASTMKMMTPVNRGKAQMRIQEVMNLIMFGEEWL